MDRSKIYAVDQCKDIKNAVCVLKKDTYKVHGTYRMRASTKRTFTALLGIGACPILVHSKVIRLGWKRMVQKKKSPKVTDALRRPMDVR